MSDDRTPEQKAADDNLAHAIERALAAYGERDPGAVIPHYMVLVEQRAWTVAGHTMTGVSSLFMEGSMPLTSILGLLRMATLQYEHESVSA